MMVLGWWLDLMILEVFSKLNDSMILWALHQEDHAHHTYGWGDLYCVPWEVMVLDRGAFDGS